MGTIRESTLSAYFAMFCAVCALSACNMPGQNGSLTFQGTATQSTPPLSGSGGSSSGPAPIRPVPTNTSPPASTLNQLQFQIGGSGVCGTSGVNQPCASVTLCTPGTSNCQTVSDLLVDTGSYGLRIFSSAVTVPLDQLQDTQGRSLVECAQFGTGADWGPVMEAKVQLAGETPVTMPVQIINSTYGGGPPTEAKNEGCTSVDTSPTQAGFNGILGIGLFTQDCGTACETNSSNGLYFGCSGGTCSGAEVALDNEVVNPISMLLADNNGVAFYLPTPTAGIPVVQGTVYFGVGTQADNNPGAVKTYFANARGNITTDFNGSSYPASFIDSGSNGLFFPDSSIPTCASGTSAPGWFCPTATDNLTATNFSDVGSTSGSVPFSIANANTMIQANPNNAWFEDLGAPSSSSGFSNSFDWGLPFFFGKTVYVGIDGANSALGSGPYWAY